MRELAVEFETRRGLRRVLDGASFSLRAGEIMGLVGESGSGKSTLIWSAAGLTPPPGRIVGGEVQFAGERLIGPDGPLEAALRRVRGTGVGLIVQNARAHLNPLATVGEQLANVALAGGSVRTRREADQAALTMLVRVALNDPERAAACYPHELSGGMAQRVMIAMATINGPSVLLADEPTMGLDVTIQAQVLDLLRAEVRRMGDAALCIVTRDLGIVANYCETVGVLEGGRIIEMAPVRDFFKGPSHPHAAALLRAATLSGAEASSSQPMLAGDPR